MISKTAEYAVRAALWLAGHPSRAWTVQSVAAEIGVPSGYLAKVLQLLGRAGLVHAQPGPGGGFLLAQSPQQTCVLDLVRAVAPLRRARGGPANVPESQAGLRPLQARLERASISVENALRGCTLADLLDESSDSTTKERL